MFSHRMAIPIAILDCDLLLHGRGHKTLERFDLEAVSDTFLHSQFGFPREFILYLTELLREVSLHSIKPSSQRCAMTFCVSGSLQTHAAIQSHQPRGAGAGRFGILHIWLFPDIYGHDHRHQSSIHVQMCV